jgi:ribosome maturation factor RimP
LIQSVGACIPQARTKGSFPKLQQPAGPTALPAPAVLSDSLNSELQRLAQGAAAQVGFEVVGVQVLSHRIPMTVQILVQRTDGSDISLDECASLSAPLGEAMDAAGLLADAYVLEVSSPGVSDELQDDRDFRSFRGFPIEVQFRDAKGETVCSEGLLLERDDTSVHLNLRGRTKRIPRCDLISVRLVTPTE